MPGTNDLSERELEILKLVATGASNKEIAQQLYISTNTVKVHLRNIFAKMEVNSRTEAAMAAVNMGLMPDVLPEVEGEAGLVPGSNGNLGEQAAAAGEAEAPVGRPVPQRRNSWIWIAGLAVLVLVAASLFTMFSGQFGTQAAFKAPTPTSALGWKERASLPTPRSDLALVAYENQIYAIAGQTNGGATGILERYDPMTDTWARRVQKPTPVSEVSAVVIGGKVYVPGGRLASGQMTNVLEIYDPRLNTWEKGANLPEAVGAYALAAFEGKLYLFGGTDAHKILNSVYEFDPDRNHWTLKTPMPTAREFAGAAVAAGKIYVIGGYDGQKALTANEVYLPERDQGQENPWETLTPLPTGRYAMGIASVADIIHIVGGIPDSEERLQALGYQTLSNTWQELENPFPEPWSDFGLAPVGTHLYGIGGKVDGQISDQNQAYQVIYTVVIPIVK